MSPLSTGVVGNPWFVSTLWLADYRTEQAGEEKDLAGSLEILKWVADHALPSGVLAEQINPLTGEPLSVSPLTWSHATFVASTQRLFPSFTEDEGVQSLWHVPYGSHPKGRLGGRPFCAGVRCHPRQVPGEVKHFQHGE